MKDRSWDDVERKVKPNEDPYEYKKKAVLDQEKSKLSLVQIYEEYTKKQNQVEVSSKVQGLLGDVKESAEATKEVASIRKAIQLLFVKMEWRGRHHGLGIRWSDSRDHHARDRPSQPAGQQPETTSGRSPAQARKQACIAFHARSLFGLLDLVGRTGSLRASGQEEGQGGKEGRLLGFSLFSLLFPSLLFLLACGAGCAAGARPFPFHSFSRRPRARSRPSSTLRPPSA